MENKLTDNEVRALCKLQGVVLYKGAMLRPDNCPKPGYILFTRTGWWLCEDYTAHDAYMWFADPPKKSGLYMEAPTGYSAEELEWMTTRTDEGPFSILAENGLQQNAELS